MAKPANIELDKGKILIPILYESRSVLALDKPPGWMLAPDSWDRTGRNLQLALQSSLNAGDFWARSRNLKFLRYVHRLDAGTSGVILFAKSSGALQAYTELFEFRQVEKTYLVVVRGQPKEREWVCRLPIAPDTTRQGRMKTLTEAQNHDADAPGSSQERDAETHFKTLQTVGDTTLIEARPLTGRTHQIRVHLAAAGLYVLGDSMYGGLSLKPLKIKHAFALRAVKLSFRDPFEKRQIFVTAPTDTFLKEYGFAPIKKASLPPPPTAPKVDKPPLQ